METGAAFLAQSREYLTGHYLPKIDAAIGRLAEADLWWRPNEASNSIGNLMLHLAGNIRQWIVTGVGAPPTSATARRSSPGGSPCPATSCSRSSPRQCWRRRR